MFRKLALGLFASAFLAKSDEVNCCGIVGTVTTKLLNQQQTQASAETKFPRTTVQQFLCDGIQLLKNRGYDSAGIFCHGNQTERLIKYADEPGSNGRCIQKVVKQTLQTIGQAYGGLAHTRWATCGAKTSRNAHPHSDFTQRIHIVHNGILSNHSALRKEYLPNVELNSQTDTQVIAQLIGLAVKNGKTMNEALNWFGSVAEKNSSQWGLVVMDKEQPHAMYTYTHGSPLLIGFSHAEDQIFVVSEKLAFQHYVDWYIATNDGQIFELDANNIKGLKQQLKNRLIKLQNEPALKQPPKQYKYWYNYEIRQQATIPFNPDFQRIRTLNFGQFLTVLACGSSNYAASSSEHLFRTLKSFRKVSIIDPIELYDEEIGEGQTAIVVSQSGQTRDLIKTVQSCQSRKTVTVGIINVQGSTLARKVDFPIYIKVGRETCVAATKSFFHQALNLHYLATEIAQQKKSAPIELIQQIRVNLKKAPAFVQQVIDKNEDKCVQLAQRLREKKSIYLLGMNESMGICKEAALKIKELNYIHAQALGACQMKHGPIALIQSDKTKETPVILYILENKNLPIMLNALDQMKSRKADTIVITDCPDKVEAHFQSSLSKFRMRRDGLMKKYEQDKTQLQGETEKIEAITIAFENQITLLQKPERDFVLELPSLPHVTHILGIIPIQLFVQKMARLKKIDPDHPRNLAKSVTV